MKKMKVLYYFGKGRHITGASRYSDLITDYMDLDWNRYTPANEGDVVHVLDIKKVRKGEIKDIKKRNIPVIVDVHDYTFLEHVSIPSIDAPARYALHKVRNTRYRKILETCDAALCHSGYMAKKLESLCGKVIKVPIGIPLNRYKTRYDWKLRKNALFVGRDYFQKGFDSVTEAMHSLKARGKNPKLKVIGSEYLHSYLLARWKARGLDVEFHHKGMDYPGVLKAYKEAKLFLRPSYVEGFGLSILEAMAASCPVIATRVGGIPELVKNTSTVLIEPGDHRALAEGISSVLEDEEKAKEMGRAGRERAKDFDVCVMSKGLEKAYQSVINSS